MLVMAAVFYQRVTDNIQKKAAKKKQPLRIRPFSLFRKSRLCRPKGNILYHHTYLWKKG